ncbi:unnamed protein product [Phyllotreta striolata]|uniref:Cytochrome P450 n=1 Tax=Phyllotreta striolata TaxID=444603 RepID=A0A9N9TPG7_PHYSR|nr:unnamed protein product [Phyllotreta striolata]
MQSSITTYLIILVVAALYILAKYKLTYWKRRNIFHSPPDLVYGNLKSTIIENKTFSSTILNIYTDAKQRGHKFFGIYKFWSPYFIPIDLDLIKCILQQNFDHFPNHYSFLNEANDPLSENLFCLHDDKWKDMRSKLAPTFSSGKLKMMFPTVISCSKNMQNILKERSEANEPIDFKDLLARFTTDVIGNVGFGVETNSLKDPASEFRQHGINVFQFNLREKFLFFLIMVLPTWLIKKLGFSLNPPERTNFFTNLVEQTVRYREENNVYRKDFMHSLIQLKNFGKVHCLEEGSLVGKINQSDRTLSINQMAAHAFTFFLAGYETSATTMTFALIELAQNQDIQDKVRSEIRKVLGKYNNEITYESVTEMDYLEQVVLETLRKHPPIFLLPRVCSKDFHIPGTDVVLRAGTHVEIPVHAIHRDPEHYPEPDKFDPERFSPENKAKRPRCAYLPFGEGPRICIGLRFGKMQSKIGLCTILNNYRITFNERTPLPVEYGPGIVSLAKGEIFMNLEPVPQ